MTENFSIGKQIVISNHTDKFIEWIDIVYEYGYTKDNIIIYDRTEKDASRIQKYGKIVKSPNVGSNIYDIGRHIYENYDNLANYTIFLKCNLLQRTYTNEKRLRYALKSKWVVPIDTYPQKDFYPMSVSVNDFISVEYINSVLQNTHTCRLEETKNYPNIKNFKEFISDLFTMDTFPEHISFCPAANYVVPKDVILKYSKKFYNKMMYYTDYHPDPVESHWFERTLLLAWLGNLEEKL